MKICLLLLNKEEVHVMMSSSFKKKNHTVIKESMVFEQPLIFNCGTFLLSKTNVCPPI